MAVNDVDAQDSARALRIDTQRVQLGRSDGVLLNLSATGALVRIPTRLALNSAVSFAMFTDGQAVSVPCQVVRCTETLVPLNEATWKHTEFDVAIVFDQRSEALGSVFELMYRQSRPA